MKWLINKCKYNKKNIIFFIIGNFIAITFVSVGISSVEQMLFLAREKNDGLPEETRVLGISLQKPVEISDIEELVKKFPKEGYYKIVNQSIYVDEGDKRVGSPLHIMFGNHQEESLEVLEGVNGKVLIGKKFKEQIDKDNYIGLYGERIKVDGVIGGREPVSKWDTRLILNIKDIPNRIKETLKSGNFQLYVETKGGNVEGLVKKVDQIIHENGYEEAVVQSSLLETDEMHMDGYKNYSRKTMIDMLVIYIISVINLIFVTNRWIYELRNEIGVMKCIGIKEVTIIKRIFIEYLVVVGLSLMLSLVFQQILFKIISGFDVVYFKVTLNNLLFGGVIAIATSVIVLLNPIRKIIYKPPVELLRR